MKEHFNISIEELEKKCLDIRKELALLRMQLVLGQFRNSAKIKALRRDIARIKTAIHMKKSEASHEQ